MPRHEPYEVAVPEPDPSFELKASGVSIGTVVLRPELNTLFVMSIQQKIFVPDMIEGITAYADSKGYNVDSVIWNPDYERFEFNLMLRLKP